MLWPTDWTRRSNGAAMPKMCQSLSNKMSYLEYFYLFWVHYQYLHHRSLFAKSVIWGQFVRINHKSLPVTVNKHQEVRLWNQTQTEAFCSTKQLQTIKCNCYFAFRLNENQQREKKTDATATNTQTKVHEKNICDQFHHLYSHFTKKDNKHSMARLLVNVRMSCSPVLHHS